MKTLHKLAFSLFLLFTQAVCFAQDKMPSDEKPEMATAMRSNGKIYVVVAVVVTILIGLVAYLVNLDRKISRMEKEDRAGVKEGIQDKGQRSVNRV